MLIIAGLLVFAFVLAEGVLRYRDVLDGPAFEENPDYGYLMRPSQSVSTRGIRFWVNNHGLRGPDFLSAKPAGTTRIAFVGCSVTYGGGHVHDRELFVNRLAEIVSDGCGTPCEGINLSAPGWGIQNMASYLRLKGAYDADTVVWVLSSADFRRPKTTRAEYGFWRIKSFSRVVYFLQGVFFVLTRASRYRRSRAREAPRSGPEVLEDNVGALRTCLVEEGRLGVRQFVVVIPMAVEDEEGRQDAERFRMLAEEQSVPFLNMKPLLDQAGVGMFVDHCHLSANGHELVARVIGKSLDGAAGDERRGSA